MHKSLIRLCCIASIVLLTACARSPVLSPVGERLPERVELSDVPFFPQSAYQCGPAALATMLNQRGVLTKLRQSAGQDVDGGCGQLRARDVQRVQPMKMLMSGLKPATYKSVL